MTEFEWVSIVLTIFTVLIIPTLALVLRLTVRLTRMDSTLTGLAEDMRENRLTTDRRLRWLEEHWWRPAPGGKRP